MKIQHLHGWDIPPQEAIKIQLRLRDRLVLIDQLGTIRFVAGCDLALSEDKRIAIAGAVVYTWPELEEVERKVAAREIAFPYVPGLLAFREAPALIEVIELLEHEPDLFFFDGQGIAHPRGLGIASHMGLLLDRPAIGCAKSRLFGEYEEPGQETGNYSPLLSKNGLTVGAVLRTRSRVQPIYVSQGHRISLETAIKFVMRSSDGYRIPKPTREADLLVETVKQKGFTPAYSESKRHPAAQGTLPFS